MAKWYLRDRGQVVGPYTTEELRAMQEQGTVASFHEVSRDGRTWKLVADVPELDKNARRAKPKPQPRPDDEEEDAGSRYAPPPDERDETPSRAYLWIVGGVLGLVALGGVALVLLLVFSPSKTKDTAKDTAGNKDKDGGSSGSPATAVSEGVITFSSQIGTRDRDRVLDESVGLIVSGLSIRAPDGVVSEVNEFGTGSGFVVTASGYLITNRHVVENLVDFRDSQKHRELERKYSVTAEPKVWVFFGHDNKFEANASAIYVSPNYDLAVLKINRASKNFFALSKTNDPDTPRFDPVFSLGFPSTDRKAQDILNPKDQKTFVRGAPIQREFRDADFNQTKERGGIRKSAFLISDAKYRDTYYLTHTATIAKGNSGGPLIANDGTVVGINTLGLIDKVGGFDVTRHGQNFAQTLPQLRREIDKQVPGVVWREASDGAK